MTEWGSYQLRCKHFKHYAEYFYAPQLQIDAVAPIKARGHYNATVLIKDIVSFSTLRKKTNATLDKVFVDIVDAKKLPNGKIPPTFHVIVQNELQGREVYGKRSTELVHVVPHWFNSFPADSVSESPVLPMPVLRPTWTAEDKPLQIALVWNPLDVEKARAKRLVALPKEGYELSQLSFEFSIGTWFAQQQGSDYTLNAVGQNESIAAILQDKTRGAPYLYQTLFRRYDVLLVIGKAAEKARYNSVQRAVSQMRSGIPVLLECQPSQAQLCVDYPCGFKTAQEMRDTLELMKNLQFRQECAQRGIEISKNYTPRKIIDAYLPTLGYQPS